MLVADADVLVVGLLAIWLRSSDHLSRPYKGILTPWCPKSVGLEEYVDVELGCVDVAAQSGPVVVAVPAVWAHDDFWPA